MSSSSSKEEEVPTSLLDSLLELRESLVSEQENEHDDGSSLQQTMTFCQKLLQRDDLSPDIQEMVYDTWMKCAFEVEDYDQVLQLCQESNNDNKDVFAAYALYRLHKYEDASAKISSNNNNNHHYSDDLWGQHIKAQSLFRLWETQEALEHYMQILSSEENNKEEENTETITNALAVAHANQVPFTSTSSSSVKALVDRATTILANHPKEEDEEYPYDLAFNVATLQLLHGGTSSTASAMTYLQQARQACQEALEEEGCSTTDIQKELMPIVTNLALATAPQQQNQQQEDGGGGGGGGTAPTTTDTQSLDRDVWNVYDTLVNKTSTSTTLDTATKRLLNKEPPTNWTVLQKCIFSYNIALLSLRTGQHSHCRQALKQIASMLKKKRKKNKSKESGASSSSFLLWWQSRMDVMEAYCLVQEKKQEEALTFLQRQLLPLEQSPQTDDDEVQQSAVAYMKLHIGMLEGFDSQTCIALLEGLPPLIRDKRGVIATLASLYQETGQTPPPPATSSSSLDDASKAELSMAQGHYQEAAALYETLLLEEEDSSSTSASTRIMWKTQHVHALTYVDAPQAETLWEEVKNEWGDEDDDNSSDDDDDSDAGELLEEAELPRLKKPKSRASSSTSSTTVTTTTSSSNTTTTKKKKNHKSQESIMRRRAKRREAYLEAKGIPETQKPNPERWIPKHERYGRRRRGGGRHGGGGGASAKAHQGGGSQKDAAKLDAAARAQAKAAGMEDNNSRSTAHISVMAGGPKRGGRRR